jgi:hypothetical protein
LQAGRRRWLRGDRQRQRIRAEGNLCVGADGDPSYDARRLVHLLIAGLLQSAKPR